MMSTTAKSPDDAREELEEPSRDAIPRGAVYRLFGGAERGGEYNGHLIFSVILGALTVAGVVSLPIFLWAMFCLALTWRLDRRPRDRKVRWRSMPGQFLLYVQVVLNAFLDALPQYAIAFLLYLVLFPIQQDWNAPVSSFVMLYGFYMVIRCVYLAVFTWALTRGAGKIHLRVFAEHRANLRDDRTALRHVWWTYFLGNIGLIVKCAVQVITIGGFELLRRSLGIDLASDPTFGPHFENLQLAALIFLPVALWFSIQLSSKVYYRAHRTLHVCKPLYDGIHLIHHRGILPTPLDSGTISPMEYFITDMARPAVMLVPNWVFTLIEIGMAFGAHLPSHDTGTLQKFAQHHLMHHKYVVFNFGLFPSDDARYGTEFIPEEPATDDSVRVDGRRERIHA